MGLFKKKFKRIEDAGDEPDQDSPVEEHHQTREPVSGLSLSADITRLKAKFDQFSELRNVFNERFSRINEQVGELRGMIMDTNRSIQDIEVKTIKAVDLVEAVQPDKLMIQVRRQDAKIEALRASLESNEIMMNTIIDQLKDVRNQMNTFRGLEQVVKLNEEVKQELTNIKKVQATVVRHSDKIEAIFVESQKKFKEFSRLADNYKLLHKTLNQVQQQSDQNKVRIQTFASKKEFEELLKKFNDYEKHVSSIVDLLSKRANELPKDIDDRFRTLEESMNNKFDKKLKKAEKINELLDIIDKRIPQVLQDVRVIGALEEIKKEGSNISAGESVLKEENKTLQDEEGFFSKLLGKIRKNKAEESMKELEEEY